jgi:hypothetical protein
MRERLVTLHANLADPTEGSAVTTAEWMTILPFDSTIVYVCVSPMDDDASATIDIQDDGTDIITAVDASDHDVPGEWISTYFAGAETPVYIAAGSELEIDVNAAANGNRFDVTMIFLTGSSSG